MCSIYFTPTWSFTGYKLTSHKDIVHTKSCHRQIKQANMQTKNTEWLQAHPAG